ncbi:MAG: nucleotidyltransferase family protein [Magnetococcales bacterium]|nr:nucleotidyltransferase family protein [Magnetococcales bacterium]
MTIDGHPPAEWLLRAWRTPGSLAAMGVETQDLVLRLARRSGLLAGLGARMEQRANLETLPPRIRDIFEGARVIGADRERSVRWEVNRIQRAFHGSGLPVILLKGAAYHLRELPMAKGRLTADVDILLPETDLPLAEQRLRAHGWVTATQDAYDQRYYREWMHELPPMRHRLRLSELDLHHAILPRTARLHPDSARLFERVQPVADHPGVWTLCPEDLVLHAVVHQFHDGDFSRMGLRDLLDLDGLLDYYGQQEGFWERLVSRAVVLNLTRPLDHALRCAARLCHTPVPDGVLWAARQASPASWPVRFLLDPLVKQTILPRHPDQRRSDPFTALAAWCLYIRSHWLRMPPQLLLPHLARKWARRWHPDVWHRRTV